ncbi:MAG: diaminopimelate epimerase [Candidatus Limnocylindria bacterium]
MRFTKMHGCGNDFIVGEASEGWDALAPARVAALCDRRTGVGADGLLVIGGHERRTWRWTIHNADGSTAEACGNGARCVARYLLDRHGGDALRLRTNAAVVGARRDGAGIAIELAPPRVVEHFSVELGGVAHSVDRVDAGNTQLVAFVDDPATVDLAPFAAAVRAVGGEGNVGCASFESADVIRLRVDERGVGETLACGTGALAAVAAATERGAALGDAGVAVHLPGGVLQVRPGATWTLSGPAEYVFEGEIRP